jgi:hypothetical protein
LKLKETLYFERAKKNKQTKKKQQHIFKEHKCMFLKRQNVYFGKMYYISKSTKDKGGKLAHSY